MVGVVVVDVIEVSVRLIVGGFYLGFLDLFSGILGRVGREGVPRLVGILLSEWGLGSK